MKLNKIQQTIYDEYTKTGTVWAECPRCSGKTTLILHIMEQEIRRGKKIMFGSFTEKILKRITDLLRERIGKDWDKLSHLFYSNEETADVVFFDEIYNSKFTQRPNQGIVCLRTPNHKVLRFSYSDLEDDVKTNALKSKKFMSKTMWDSEYNNFRRN